MGVIPCWACGGGAAREISYFGIFQSAKNHGIRFQRSKLEINRIIP